MKWPSLNYKKIALLVLLAFASSLFPVNVADASINNLKINDIAVSSSIVLPQGTTSAELTATIPTNATADIAVNNSTVSNVSPDVNGDISFTIDDLNSGENTITIVSKNGGSTLQTKKISLLVDNGQPQVFDLSPAHTATVTTSSVTITGSVHRVTTLKLGQDVITINNGTFSKTVNLTAGTNTFTFSTGDNIVLRTYTINYVQRPEITVTSSLSASSSSYTLRGEVNNATRLTVNGSSVSISSNGTFSKTISLSKQSTLLTLRAYNGSYEEVRNVTIDYVGRPILTLSSPVDGSTVYDDYVEVSGTVFPADLDYLDVTCNTDTTEEITPNSDSGRFSTVVLLNEGDNTLTFSAINGITEMTPVIVKVKYENVPDLDVDDLTDKMTVFTNKLTISGDVDNISAGGLKINGELVEFNYRGSFSKEILLKAGSNTITITATRENKTITKTYTVFYNEVPKEDAEVELKLKQGETVSAFAESISITTSKSDYLENTAEISVVDPRDADYPLNGSAFVSSIFEVDFDEEPLQPFKLSLKYDSVIKEASVRKLTIFYYDEDENSWQVIGGVIDSTKKTVTLEVIKEGKYAAAIYYKNFDDTATHWARNDIEYLVAQGVVSGSSDTRFNPNSLITRVEFTTFLAKACRLKPYDPDVPSFSDVYSGHWAYKWVEAAARAGLVSGINSYNFSPYRSITREEAAIMLARAANAKLLDEAKAQEVLSKFNDKVKVQNYATKEVATMVDAGLLQGMADKSFRPQGTTTRAQAVAMIVRLMENLQKDSKSTKSKTTRTTR